MQFRDSLAQKKCCLHKVTESPIPLLPVHFLSPLASHSFIHGHSFLHSLILHLSCTQHQKYENEQHAVPAFNMLPLCQRRETFNSLFAQYKKSYNKGHGKQEKGILFRGLPAKGSIAQWPSRDTETLCDLTSLCFLSSCAQHRFEAE